MKKRRDDLLKGPKEKAIEAIKAGRTEEAIKFVKELAEDSHPVHDRMSEWSNALLTYIGDKLGEEAVLDATRRLMNEIYSDRFEQLRKLSHEEIVQWNVRSARTHFSKFYVEEDDEKTALVITNCGAGGRLMKEGKYDISDRYPINWGTTKKAYPWSYNTVGMPWYCVHMYVWEEICQKAGLKMRNQWGFQYDKDGNPIDDPCRYVVYKK